jgi:hypothetical protein
MKHGLLHHPPIPKVFDHDPLQELRRHTSVPDPFRVHDDDWAAAADTETGCLASLDARRTEEEAFALEKRRQEVVQRSTALFGRAKAPHAHEHMV